MSDRSLVHSRHEILGGENRLISAREAADILGITQVTAMNWIDDGLLIPQKDLQSGGRTMYSFDPAYLAEVKAVLPKKKMKRGHKLPINIRALMLAVNAKWSNR